ncbi:MAG: hypothetical protein JW395_0274 [Nitrospira sp.]|nr:hypothetical protein [Nitrospira sp.]
MGCAVAVCEKANISLLAQMNHVAADVPNDLRSLVRRGIIGYDDFVTETGWMSENRENGREGINEVVVYRHDNGDLDIILVRVSGQFANARR